MFGYKEEASDNSEAVGGSSLFGGMGMSLFGVGRFLLSVACD